MPTARSRRRCASCSRASGPASACSARSTAATAASGWILDPIDGTRNFVRGIPVWATLIASRSRRRGVVSAPALGRRWWAERGGGAFADGEPIRVSRGRPARGRDASLRARAGRRRRARSTRGTSAASATSGRTARRRGRGRGCDRRAGPRVWDFAAVRVIVEEAGGRFEDPAPRTGGSTSASCARPRLRRPGRGRTVELGGEQVARARRPRRAAARPARRRPRRARARRRLVLELDRPLQPRRSQPASRSASAPALTRSVSIASIPGQSAASWPRQRWPRPQAMSETAIRSKSRPAPRTRPGSPATRSSRRSAGRRRRRAARAGLAERRLSAPAAERRQVGEQERLDDRAGHARALAAEPQLDHLRAAPRAPSPAIVKHCSVDVDVDPRRASLAARGRAGSSATDAAPPAPPASRARRLPLRRRPGDVRHHARPRPLGVAAARAAGRARCSTCGDDASASVPPPASGRRGGSARRRSRPPAAGRVVREARPVALPGGDDRVDERPLLLDLVRAREERRVAEHRVEDQPLVRLGQARCGRRRRRGSPCARCGSSSPAPGTFAPIASETPSSGWTWIRSTFGRSPSPAISANGGCGARWNWIAIVVSRRGQPLAGADVERRVRPAPVVDVELRRDVRLRRRVGRDAGLLAVAGHLLALDEARARTGRARRASGPACGAPAAP